MFRELSFVQQVTTKYNLPSSLKTNPSSSCLLMEKSRMEKKTGYYFLTHNPNHISIAAFFQNQKPVNLYVFGLPPFEQLERNNGNIIQKKLK